MEKELWDVREIIPYDYFLRFWHDIMGQGGNVYAKGAR